MKKVVLLLVTVLAFNLSNAQLVDKDKQFHLGGGFFAAAPAYALGLDLTNGNKKQAKLISIASTLVLGTVKEALDARKRNQGGGGNGFDVKDLAYTVAGGIVGTYTFEFVFNRAARRSAKRLEEAKKIYK